MAYPKILEAVSKRAVLAAQRVVELCFLIYERVLQLATAFGVPAAARGATQSLVKVVAAAKKNSIPESMLKRAQLLLKEGAPHYIANPAEGHTTVDGGAMVQLLSDEEEQQQAEAELEAALSRAMYGGGADAEGFEKVPAPPQILPSSIVPAGADTAPKKKRVIRSNDVLHKLQQDTLIMECRHKPTKMIMKLVAQGERCFALMAQWPPLCAH